MAAHPDDVKALDEAFVDLAAGAGGLAILDSVVAVASGRYGFWGGLEDARRILEASGRYRVHRVNTTRFWTVERME